MKRFAATLIGLVLCLAWTQTAQAQGGGYVPRPGSLQAVLRPYTSVNLYVSVTGGQTATVVLTGNGVSRFDAQLYDSQNRLLAAVANETTLTIRWRPSASGVFRIIVQARNAAIPLTVRAN